tara:strand:+ start:4123 stop:4347 length:225 start_codon:yes stop_codon:yes gene_type:complete
VDIGRLLVLEVSIMILKAWAIGIIIFTSAYYITGANDRGEIIWAEICNDPPNNLISQCDEYKFHMHRVNLALEE